MASQQLIGLGALGAIACYTVDSDDSDDTDDEDMEEEEENISIASQIIDTILNKVTGGVIKLEIKEEPLDIKLEPEEYENITVTPNIGWMTDTVGYRDPTTIKIEDDSEDSDSDSDSSSTDSSDDDKELSAPKVVEEPKSCNESVKSKNELNLSDLPPIEDLQITVSEEECVKIGTIASCVQELVVIESVPGNPALDLDTVLFLDFGKRTLGHIFDVIGPVMQPIYCVRFNSAEHIQEKTVSPGMSVFYAPKTPHTSYVFLEQLMKMKISDASWANDEEPPPNFLEYSDDEQERKAKQELKLERMKNAGATEDEIAAKRGRFTRGRNKNEAMGDRLPGAVEPGGSNHRDRGDNKGQRNANRQSGSNNATGRFNNTAAAGDGASGAPSNSRAGNGMYGQNNNPFYRRSRTYDPKENGPIQWDSALPAQAPARSNFSTTPTPQYSNVSQYSNAPPPFGAPAAYPRQPPMYGQPNLFHNNQQNKNQSRQPPHQNQWQQPQAQQQSQWQQPPPQSHQQSQWDQPQSQSRQQSPWEQSQPRQESQWQPPRPQARQESQWHQQQQQQQQARQDSQWQQANRQPQIQQQPRMFPENQGYRTSAPPPPPGT